MNVRFIEWKLSFTTRGGCPLLYFVEFDSLFLWNMGNSQRLHAAWTTWRLLIIHWPPLLQSEKINPGMEGCPPPAGSDSTPGWFFFRRRRETPNLTFRIVWLHPGRGETLLASQVIQGFAIYIYIFISPLKRQQKQVDDETHLQPPPRYGDKYPYLGTWLWCLTRQRGYRAAAYAAG